MQHIDYLNSFIDLAVSTLERVRKNGVKKELSFDFQSSDLEDYNHIDIRNSLKFKNIFEMLKISSGPSLYWFEIISDVNKEEIIKELRNYKNILGAKSTPSIRNNINYDSNILYLGKVKSVFWGRLIQHMGYFKVDATQGLQLYHWIKNVPVSLRVHVLEFEPEMANLMPIIEYAFAQELKPLIGKHK